MPSIVYTVCTLNYLAYAKAMGFSVIKHNPSYKIVIGIVDKIDGRIETADYVPFEIVEAENVIDAGIFGSMYAKYNLLELSCAFKPIFAEYLFEKYLDCQKLIYLDIDILVFNPLIDLEKSLDQATSVITPHIFEPIQDNLTPQEESFLNAGIYNAGFLAFSRKPEAFKLLAWWRERVIEKGFLDPQKGLFADQIWLNFMPLFFKNVLVETNVGYNMAYWNLHERQINQKEDSFWVNGNTPLLFFHFSGYRLDKPNTISVHQDRFNFENTPELKPLFEIYHEAVLQNGFEKYQHIPNAYIKTQKRTPLRIAQFLMLRYAKKLVNYLEEVLRK